MVDLFSGSRVKTRRFAIYPIIKDANEDLALQQIQLRENFCLGALYPTDDGIVQGKFYYYVNSVGIECLICEVSVRLDDYAKLSQDSLQCFSDDLITAGLQVEDANKIIMEGIRTPYHAEDYIRLGVQSIMIWVASKFEAQKGRRE